MEEPSLCHAYTPDTRCELAGWFPPCGRMNGEDLDTARVSTAPGSGSILPRVRHEYPDCESFPPRRGDARSSLPPSTRLNPSDQNVEIVWLQHPGWFTRERHIPHDAGRKCQASFETRSARQLDGLLPTLAHPWLGLLVAVSQAARDLLRPLSECGNAEFLECESVLGVNQTCFPLVAFGFLLSEWTLQLGPFIPNIQDTEPTKPGT